MYDRQLELLDMLAIISFGLQMEFLTQNDAQVTTAALAAQLDRIEEKLDKLLSTIT